MNIPSIPVPHSLARGIAAPQVLRWTWRRRIGLGIVLAGSSILGAQAIDAVGIRGTAPTALSSPTK